MRELMLRPGWPGGFRRTVGSGKKSRAIGFQPGQPVKVTDDEFKQLTPDVGVAVFEVERDEKDRPRFVETQPEPTTPKPEAGGE